MKLRQGARLEAADVRYWRFRNSRTDRPRPDFDGELSRTEVSPPEERARCISKWIVRARALPLCPEPGRRVRRSPMGHCLEAPRCQTLTQLHPEPSVSDVSLSPRQPPSPSDNCRMQARTKREPCGSLVHRRYRKLSGCGSSARSCEPRFSLQRMVSSLLSNIRFAPGGGIAYK